MKQSGLADSPFFLPASRTESQEVTANVPDSPGRSGSANHSRQTENAHVSEPPRHGDTLVPSNRDGTVSRYQDTTIEFLRKAVRELGKEAATHRYTAEEKRAILGIIYSYAGAGIRTSENEVTRIALNFIIKDHTTNGKSSILDRVLKALNT